MILFFGAAAGCSPADNANASSGQSTPAATAGDLLASRCAYERACAGCHDAGLNGAPAVGDQEAWADRASLWVAVLEEQAKEGYLDMPARGGDPALSAGEVAATTEYMLSLTHPDRPVD
ncbi:MAG: cytochrome c5 family protein [Woeseiaceae bacterium]